MTVTLLHSAAITILAIGLMVNSVGDYNRAGYSVNYVKMSDRALKDDCERRFPNTAHCEMLPEGVERMEWRIIVPVPEGAEVNNIEY